MKWRVADRHRRVWSKRARRRWDDRGVALIAALLVVVLVAMLGAVAVEEAVNGSHQGAVTAKDLQTSSAGRAGVDAVLAGIQSVSAESVLAGGNPDPPCPSVTTANSTGGAVNAASGETYSLWYEVFPLSDEPGGAQLSKFGDAVQQVLDSNPGATDWPSSADAALPSGWSPPSYCGPGGHMVGFSPGESYYVALAAGGNTTSTANGWVGKPSVALLQMTPGSGTTTTTTTTPPSSTTTSSTSTSSATTTTTVAGTTTTTSGSTTTTAGTTTTTTTTTVPSTTTTTTAGSSATFSEGVFAGDELTMNGDFLLYEVSGGPSIPPGIPTYTPGYLDCQNTGDYENGDVWAGATGNLTVKHVGTDGTSGSCLIAGNLYLMREAGATAAYPGGGDPSAEVGSTVFSASTTVDGNVYLAGTGDLSSSGNVTLGNILTNGSVTLTSGTVKVNGSIYAVGNVDITLNSGSYITGDVYSSTGTVTINMKGGSFTGAQYPGTPWPTSPSPCAGSYVTCDPSGNGLVTPFPRQPFPSLTAANFPNYSVWVDPNDTNPYPSGCTSNVDSGVASMENNSSTYNPAYAADRPAVGDATYAVYHEIETATTPTVVETPCAFEWDDSATSGTITINSDIAILAEGGFTTGGDWNNPGVQGEYTSTTYKLYMVVPYTGSGPYPANGEPTSNLSSCPESVSQPPNVYEKNGYSANGDIWLKGGSPAFGQDVPGSNPVTQNVHVFFYTPDNMCTEANPEMTGQVYVGGYLATGSGWTMTVDPDLSPSSGGPSTTTTTSVGESSTTTSATTTSSTTTSSPTTTVASSTTSSSTSTVPGTTTSSTTTSTGGGSTTTTTLPATGDYWQLSVLSLG